MANLNCPKCHGTGYVKEKNGTVHTCFDCLTGGDMDQHDKNVRDSNIKL